MIKVNYHKDDGYVKNLTVLGHADYSKNDELDLVCACVSSIVIGGLNAIKDEKNYIMSVTSGNVKLEVIKANDSDNKVIETILIQLKTLETKYSKNINVKEK